MRIPFQNEGFTQLFVQLSKYVIAVIEKVVFRTKEAKRLPYV